MSLLTSKNNSESEENKRTEGNAAHAVMNDVSIELWFVYERFSGINEDKRANDLV